MIATFVKEAFSEGLSEAMQNYAINRLVVKYAQPFRNDCAQGAWSELSRGEWPHLTHRGGEFHARFNNVAYEKFESVIGRGIPIVSWECVGNECDVLKEPNGRTTPCIAINAGYLTEANLRLGRQVKHYIYIPLYTR